MADWKSRAVKVDESTATPAPTASWKDRAKAVEAEAPAGPTKLEQLQMILSRGSRALPGPLAAAMNPAVQSAALSGMKFVSGAARTGVAGLAGQANLQDAFQALQNRAPTTEDYLARRGVGELGKVETPELGPIPAMALTGRNVLGLAGDVATDPLTYAATLGRGLQGAGKMAYKSGLKNLDKEVAKYGKEPVSDILFNERIKGSAQSVKEQMTALADQRLAERNAILERATKAGAEVDMNQAIRPAEDLVAEMKALDNPEQAAAIEALNNRVDTYRGRAARTIQDPQPEAKVYMTNAVEVDPSNMRVRTPRDVERFDGIKVPENSPLGMTRNPIVGDAPTAVINDELDQIIGLPVQSQMTRIAGPSPIQASSWKSSAANRIGDKAWEALQYTPEGARFDKALSSGLRSATEDSVSRTLGRTEGLALAQKNDELGRLLSSADRAERDAAIASRKHYLSQIDGALLANGLEHPGSALAYLGKTAARLAQATGPRTYGGLALDQIGQDIGGLSRYTGAAVRPLIDNTNDSPWDRLGRRNK